MTSVFECRLRSVTGEAFDLISSRFTGSVSSCEAFGFDRILYESNWFVNEAMGDAYDRTATLLPLCERSEGSVDGMEREDETGTVDRCGNKSIYWYYSLLLYLMLQPKVDGTFPARIQETGWCTSFRFYSYKRSSRSTCKL